MDKQTNTKTQAAAQAILEQIEVDAELHGKAYSCCGLGEGLRAADIVADAILRQVEVDAELYKRVYSSCEPLRAMVYETDVIADAAALDGSCEWDDLIDALEEIY